MASSGDFNHIPEAIAAIKRGIAAAITAAASEGQQIAREHAAVDTGYMRDHVYHVTATESTYEDGEKSLPEIEKPPDDQTAYIASAARHSVFVEYGTSHMGAQPFMTPMAEAMRAKLPDLLREHIGNAIKDALGG